MPMTDEQYRRTLEAEVDILHLMADKEPRLMTDEELRAVFTRRLIAQFDLPANTVLTEEQFWTIADRLYPEAAGGDR